MSGSVDQSQRPRNLVLFSDGTGNAAGKANGTNVWRMYQALNRAPKADTDPVQLAVHDDGVGSSGSQLPKILGGAFGFGLAANVRELYLWLARTYRPGDNIYMFGFSRGAFTVRCLAGMVAKCGIMKVAGVPSGVSQHRAFMAWTAYKRCQSGSKKAGTKAQAFKNEHGVLADASQQSKDVRIKFIGVWDTVDAYGLPVDEAKDAMAACSSFLERIPLLKHFAVTRFKDRHLSPLVDHASHAVALHDERHTFHPVLWDEGKDGDDRIEQVWFSGAHSDVGGGYVRGSLSLEPLHWMMTQAEEHGLRLLKRHVDRVWEEKSAEGPLHDSRAGGGVFYRYRPRDVHELCEEHHVPVRVHASVLERVEVTMGHDAPKGLPHQFEVVGSSPLGGDKKPNDDTLMAQRGVDCWRRCLYAGFLTLILFVVWRSLQPPAVPLPQWWYLGRAVDKLSDFIPDVLLGRIDALRSQPLSTLIAAGLLVVFAILRTKLRGHSERLRREAWGFAKPSSGALWINLGTKFSIGFRSVAKSMGMLYGLLATGVIGTILTLAFFVAVDDESEVSKYPSPIELGVKQEALLPFNIKDREGKTNVVLIAGYKYQFKVIPGPWKDKTLPATPTGLTSPAPSFMKQLERFRTLPDSDWMTLLGSIGTCDADPFVIGAGRDFTPKTTGRLYLHVNDAVCYWRNDPWFYYKNNEGTAEITVTRVK